MKTAIASVSLNLWVLVALAPNVGATEFIEVGGEELAERLGVPADFAGRLQEIPLDIGGSGPTAPRPKRVEAGHAGGDRYVFRITFAEPFCREDWVFHLYADVDNDPETGRQDSPSFRGTDMMYSFVAGRNDPRFMNPAVRTCRVIPVRGVVRGNAVYVSDDIRVPLRDERTDFRIRLLSHLRSENRDSYSSGWTDVRIAADAPGPAPRLPIPEPFGVSSLTMPNFAELAYRVWQDPDTVRLRPAEARVQGYQVLMNDDFDGMGRREERAVWQSPVAGTYHVGLVLSAHPERLQQQRRMDLVRQSESGAAEGAAGPAGLDLRVDGELVGTLVGDPRATGDVIYFTSKPVALREGLPIEVRSAEYSGAMVFHSVHLSKQPPQVPPLRIENLSAWHMPDEPGELPDRILVAWTTNRPTDAVIHAHPVEADEETVRLEGRGRVNNHLVVLTPDLTGEAWDLEIVCREAERDAFPAQQTSARFRVHRDRTAHQRSHGLEAYQAPRVVRIPLQVQERAERGRRAWPMRSGVPLPHGLLPEPSAVRLLDAGGNDVALQSQALAWWPDGGSVQWLLLDFSADTTAGETASYTLEVNSPPAVPAPSGIRIEGTPAEHEGPVAPLGRMTAPLLVDTGPLTLRLGPGGFAPFSDVTIKGRKMPAEGGGFQLTDAEGVTYSSANEPPDEIVVEQRGPLRATLAVRGRLVDPAGNACMRYLCRLHFYAGKPYVRTVFTLENDVLRPDMNSIARLWATVPMDLSEAAVTVGGDGQPLDLEPGGRLLQDEDFRFIGSVEGHRADGWLLARGPDGALGVAVRDFWKLYPKAFRRKPHAVCVELLPELPADQYADAGDDALTQWYFWNDGGRYRIRTGVRLTTEFAVDWRPELDPEAPGDFAAGTWWSQPLFAACTPDWYCGAGVLDTLVPRRSGSFDRYEHQLDTAFARFRQRQEREREYGFMNYGDWFGERTWNWGNIEYDTPWALVANFLRTGNRDMLHHAAAAAAHAADIDTIHHHADPNRIGYVYTHCIGHTAGYFPREWKGMGGFNVHGGNRGGHIWSQGKYAVWALTGEERLRETADKITRMLAHYTTDFRIGAERSVGWPMIATMAGYDLTGNPYYRNAAQLMADIVVWSQHPERGLWGHWIDPNECDHEPRCWGAKPFMTGVLLRGMKMVHRADPREDVLESMLRNVDFLFEEAYVSEGERPGFVYSGCRHERFSARGSVSRLSLIGPGIAYAVLQDPERRHLPMLEHAAQLYFQRAGISDFGKSFTQATCFLPTVMHDLTELGLTDFNESPDP